MSGHFQSLPAPSVNNAKVRTETTFTTGVLVDQATAVGAIQLAKTFNAFRLETSVPARVRLYSSISALNLDAQRPGAQPPSGDHGVILDIITYQGKLVWDLAPTAVGASLETPPTATTALAVTNRSGGPSAVQVTITYLEIE